MFFQVKFLSFHSKFLFFGFHCEEIRRASDVIRPIYYSQLCGCHRWRFESVDEEFEFQELFKEEAMDMYISCPQPSNRDFFLLEKQIYEYMVAKRKNVKNLIFGLGSAIENSKTVKNTLFLFSPSFFFFLPLSLVFCVVQVACSRALLHHVNMSIRQS